MSKKWFNRLKELSVQYESSIVQRNLSSKNINHLLHGYMNSVSSYRPVAYRSFPKVFSNNYFNMEEVKAVGFDLDYTLVTYSPELQHLIFDIAKEMLIQAFGFPSSMRSCTFDPNFAIRGLSVDTNHGVICKLSNLKKVGLRYAYKGKAQLSLSQIDSIYGESRHISHGDLRTLRPLYDLYSIAEACLIADAIDHFEHRKITKGELYIPSVIIDDIQNAIRDVHTSGVMQNAILADLPRYINPSPDLADLIAHLRNGGKKLFLCTNSGFKYVNATLSFLLQCKQDSSDWRDIFDIIICSASKPDFYFSKRPFRKWNTLTDTPLPTPVGELTKGDVFVHGSIDALKRSAGWMGKDVLYVGDNLKSDLMEARRWHGWHTACVIEELDKEIGVQNSVSFQELHFLRSTTRNLLEDLQRELEELRTIQSVSGHLHTHSMQFSFEDTAFLREVETALQEINGEMSLLFNKQFGSIFRTDGHPSLYASEVKRYCDIYMGNACNLLSYNPRHKFYPTHSIHNAHDPKK